MNRPCAEPGCPELVQHGPRCKAHTRDNERQINRVGKKVYRSKAWQLTRRSVLFDEPMCRYCAATGREQLAEEVHHIDGNPFNNARLNLAPSCKPCHSRTTRREQLERASAA